ncbi:hypothetical protein D3C80_2184220 [compost metagenome]
MCRVSGAGIVVQPVKAVRNTREIRRLARISKLPFEFDAAMMLSGVTLRYPITASPGQVVVHCLRFM